MDMDLNIENYTISELMSVLTLLEEPTSEEVIEKSQALIDKFTNENKLVFADFFTKARDKVLEYIDQLDKWEEEYKLIVDEVLIRNQDNLVKVSNTDQKLAITNIQKMLVINTEFIDSAQQNHSDFTFNLPDIISDVTSIALYSFHIPFTWYSIDSEYGTNFFYIIQNGVEEKIEIDSGNYTNLTLSESINEKLSRMSCSCEFNSVNGKITFKFSSNISLIKFFKESDNSKINNNLGYILGFRATEYNVHNKNTLISEGICNISGTKYLQLMIDDFNKNRLNTNIINAIDNKNENLKISNVFQNIERNQYNLATNTDPPTMTQLETEIINKIEEDNNNNKLFLKTKINSGSDMFAMIPTKHHQLNLGDMCVEFGGTLQNNRRNYFGPTTLSRMRVRLLDDKGNTINLNNSNWSFTIICDTLYEGNQMK
tara:strand:- start:483 stop:1766 length:1284 start_codon:yes stop_codon:yes gene_type:complete